MATPRKLNPMIHRRHTDTCGLREGSIDTFADVTRAVTAWLMKNDSKYRETYEARVESYRIRKENKERERSTLFS